MIDIFEILNAWGTKLHPTEEQKKLAEKRATICSSCEFAKKNVCSICGCILAAKVYSSRENPCPKRKWTCDTEYFNSREKVSKVI